MKLIEAIARIEGFGVKGSRPNRDENPGDIDAGSFSQAHGATGSDGRFAIFPDAVTGYAALVALLKSPSYINLTVEQAINRYAPPVENQTSHYVAVVCGWVGCQPSTLIKDLL
jgi:hypothetical protein